MIGKKELQRYRDMSIEDRLREFAYLMEVAFEALRALPEAERRRRWAIWARRDEEAAQELAERLRRLAS